MNPLFNEDTLIKHYYKECPVLTTCPSCKMVRHDFIIKYNMNNKNI